MQVYTLNVGQGAFAVITCGENAVIIDTQVQLGAKVPNINILGALAKILKNKNLLGLLITGFDRDHFTIVGLKIVLNKYRPEWIIYPGYYKDSGNAEECFKFIRDFAERNKTALLSIDMAKNQERSYSSGGMSFELFSPHKTDMTSSNNCSLVCKIKEISTGASYLVTGDTELARWKNICSIFGSDLKCHVMAAPHHGSDNGTSEALMRCVQPHTVLFSCGIGNSYGHPGSSALSLFKKFATEYWGTNAPPSGQSLRTVIDPFQNPSVQSFKFELGA